MQQGLQIKCSRDKILDEVNVMDKAINSFGMDGVTNRVTAVAIIFRMFSFVFMNFSPLFNFDTPGKSSQRHSEGETLKYICRSL